MSSYTRNAIYDYVRTAILNSYSTCYVTSSYEKVPPSFPTAYIREISKMTPTRNVTLNGDDVQYEVTFEVQVFSNKKSGQVSQAYSIMDKAREAFKDLFFIQTSEIPYDSDATPDQFRLIGRFHRTIGGGDQFPTQ